jgi:hypothetical protein
VLLNNKLLEGFTVAKRNRYRELENKVTLFIAADVAVFVLYLVFAGAGIVALKVIASIVTIMGALLALGFLFMSGELLKKRSLWMTVAFASVLLCTIVSLVCNFPGPK